MTSIEQKTQILIIDQRNINNKVRHQHMITQIQAGYVQTKTQPKAYVPFNLVPSDLIKCIHCNSYVHHAQINLHIQRHQMNNFAALFPNNISNHKCSQSQMQNSKILSKISLHEVLYQKQKDAQQISVKSMLPQQMPTEQKTKKEAFLKPQGIHIIKAKQNLARPQNVHTYSSNQQFPDSLENMTQQTCNEQEQFPQPEQMINFKKQIKLNTKKVCIQSKNLQFYSNQNSMVTGWYTNHNISLNKKHQNNLLISDENKQNEFYAIQKINKKPEDKKNSLRKIQIKTSLRQPANKQYISTFSSTGTAHNQFFNLNWAKNTQNDNQTEEGDHAASPANNFQCSECRGFYCKTCGSDIPPLYRPALSHVKYNQDHKNSKIAEQKVSSFYASHVFNKQNGKTSRLTGCSNCQ